MPEEKLKKGENIWNVGIIDNIDFAEMFTYDSIFDTTRRTRHMTLQMVFQFELPLCMTEIRLRVEAY